MNAEAAERLIRQYVDGWRDRDTSKILDAVAEDCVVVESHGPTYHGKDQIARWIETWFGAGGKVSRWQITSLEAGEGAAAFEWSFACEWLGKSYEFEGASIVRLEGGKISSIREYATTAPLYDWEGVWR